MNIRVKGECIEVQQVGINKYEAKIELSFSWEEVIKKLEKMGWGDFLNINELSKDLKLIFTSIEEKPQKSCEIIDDKSIEILKEIAKKLQEAIDTFIIGGRDE